MRQEVTSDVRAAISKIIAELNATPDRLLGGPAAPAARANAKLVAEYLLQLGDEPLPRHAGNASPGKVAQAISTEERRFNRQNFSTNEWCERLLRTYDQWELASGLTRIEAAQAANEQKEPTNKRISELERELLLAHAEVAQLRREVAFLRGFTAETGRLP